MIQIQLPDTFGTGTLHGLFYERAVGGLNVKKEPIDTGGVSLGNFTFSQMNAALDQQLIFRLPVNLDVKKLLLIAQEADSFYKWVELSFHKTPKILFT